MRHKVTFVTVRHGGRLEIEVDGKPVFDETWTHSFYTPVSILKMIVENERLPEKLHDLIQESKNNDKRYYLQAIGGPFGLSFRRLNDATWEIVDTEYEERYYIHRERELYEDMLLALWIQLRGY